MATFGSIASANPNVLFDPARAIGAAQEQQRNQLLMEATQTRMANDVQDRQRAEFERDREEAGRLAYATTLQPPEKRKEFYETGIAALQAQGRMLRSPAKFDQIGDAGLERAVAMFLGPQALEQRQERLADRSALGARYPMPGGAAAPASVPSVPGAAPAAPTMADVPAELIPHFEEASRATGVPVPLLIAQAKQESGFRADARGRSGEIGIMQVMPSTAQQPGFGLQPVDPATLNDPRANIMFGAQYLAARNKGVDWNDPTQRDAGLGRYNGGGDPNYAANVTRNLPAGAPAPQPTPPGGVAARTGGTDTAGPGAGPASPAVPQIGSSGFTPQQERALAERARSRGTTQAQMDALEHTFRTENAAALRHAEAMALRRAEHPPADPTAAFGGNGIEAQANNILLRVGPKIADGTASEAERQQYALAHGHLTRGTVQLVDDGKGGQVLARIPGQVPSSFPAPDFQPGAAGSAPAAAGGASAQGAAQPIPGTAKPAQTVSADDRSKLREIEVNAQGIVDALDDYVTTRGAASTRERVASIAGAPTTLSTTYGNAGLLAKGKALYDLGVLNGPDLDIIRRVLADPSTVRGGALTSQETVKEQADKIKELLRKRLETARREYSGGSSVAGPTPGSTAEPPPPPGKRPPLSSFGG
jgi:soluble lytic murein transglycosylase-like protein